TSFDLSEEFRLFGKKQDDRQNPRFPAFISETLSRFSCRFTVAVIQNDRFDSAASVTRRAVYHA
ncbi:hypothetical protein ABLN85_13295, partial [Mycobacterium tuberculosis]